MKHSFRDQWLEGTKLEYDTLLKLNTFRIVPLPEDAQIIPVMWTFVYKFDTNGFLVKFKARMCARGDMQKMTPYASTLAVTAWSGLCHRYSKYRSPFLDSRPAGRLRYINSLYLSVSLCSFSFSCLIFSSKSHLDSYRSYFLYSKLGS
jgi:hypothetical protein